MTARWTFEEDKFLHAYYDGVGDFVGTHDLHRPKGAATRRVKRLKELGAWAAMDRMRKAEAEYHEALGTKLPPEEDE